MPDCRLPRRCTRNLDSDKGVNVKLGPSIFLVALVPLLIIEDSPAPNALFTFTVPFGLPSGLSIAPACPHILPPEEAKRAAISSVA